MRITEKRRLQLLQDCDLPFRTGVEDCLMGSLDHLELLKTRLELIAIPPTREKRGNHRVSTLPKQCELPGESAIALFLEDNLKLVLPSEGGEHCFTGLDPTPTALSDCGGSGVYTRYVFRQQTGDLPREIR